MTLEAAAIRLIAALRQRAASWMPCEVTPGELAREWGGPPAALVGRVMRGWLTGAMVLDAMERGGVAARYDRRRVFELRRLIPAESLISLARAAPRRGRSPAG